MGFVALPSRSSHVAPAFDGQLSPKAPWTLARILFGGREASILDPPNLLRGFWSSLDSMWAPVSKLIC